MILRVSAAFSKQFKCVLSHPGESVPQERRLDAWSCHFIRVRRKPLVVVMNDATLYTLILPVTGVKGFPELWLKLLGRIGEVWTRHGADFDPDNQTVVLLSRTNRSLIGSMNDATLLIRIYDGDAKAAQMELDLADMETRSNQTPYKALNYQWPERLMALALRGQDLKRVRTSGKRGSLFVGHHVEARETSDSRFLIQGKQPPAGEGEVRRSQTRRFMGSWREEEIDD